MVRTLLVTCLLILGTYLLETAGAPPPGDPAPAKPSAGRSKVVELRAGESVEAALARACGRVSTEAAPLATRRGPGVSWVSVGSAETAPEHSALDAVYMQTRIPADQDVEAVFVLDTTGSMGWVFQDARDKALALLEALEASRDDGHTVRAGLVTYRDRGEAHALDVHPLTSDWTQLRAAFSGLRADGGGDTPEDVAGGVQAALDRAGLSERAGTTRMIYLIGDAPAKRFADAPDLAELGARAADRGVQVHTFNAAPAGSSTHHRVAGEWRALSAATGGQYEVIEPKLMKDFAKLREAGAELGALLKAELGALAKALGRELGA